MGDCPLIIFQEILHKTGYSRNKFLKGAIHEGSLCDLGGQERTAFQEGIRQAWKNATRRHHPDASGTPASTRDFLKAREAFEVLSDSIRRARYDQTLVQKNGIWILQISGIPCQGSLLDERRRLPCSFLRRDPWKPDLSKYEHLDGVPHQVSRVCLVRCREPDPNPC